MTGKLCVVPTAENLGAEGLLFRYGNLVVLIDNSVAECERGGTPVALEGRGVHDLDQFGQPGVRVQICSMIWLSVQISRGGTGWPAETGQNKGETNSHCGGASVLLGSETEQPITLEVHTPSSSCLASLTGSSGSEGLIGHDETDESVAMGSTFKDIDRKPMVSVIKINRFVFKK